MGTTDFLLNCFVLGDDEERMFPVKAPRNDNVGILKDLIKEKNPHALDRVDAKDLDLWKVCLSIDDPASKQPQTGPPLRVNKRLSSLWDDEPSDDDLHILVKAPGRKPTCMPSLCSFSNLFKISKDSDPAQLLLLNCFILSDKPNVTFEPNETFPIEVLKTKNVGILKDLIKEKKAHRLKHVDASDLILSQVSLTVDGGVGEILRSVEFTPLNPVLPLSQVFPRVEEKHLHIVVQAPTNGEILSVLLYTQTISLILLRGPGYQ